MSKSRLVAVGFATVVVLTAGLLSLAKTDPTGEQERKVKETEVPKAALEAIKKLADKASITEFAEETGNGHKFYEGSWTGPSGRVDGLVTESGDLVEIEETVPAGSVPAAVRTELEKHVGKDAKVSYEKKTMVLYETHFKNDDKAREMVFTPDGRTFHEQGDKTGSREEDDDKD